MNQESIILMYLQKIEKAISMPNRYEVFSQDIIKNLIETYLKNKESLLPEIIQGIFETVHKYKLSLNLEIKENKEIVDFINNSLKEEKFYINERINHNKEKSYYFDLLKDLIKSRYSVRNYSNKTVPYSLIEKSLEIANSFPTPCNRQACKLIIIENKEIRDEILNHQQGNKGFSAPVLAAITVESTAFSQENEDLAPYFHAGSFSAGLVLGLESVGLSSCILNWHVSKEVNEKIKFLLNLKEKEITAFIFIGYAQKGKNEAYSIKKKSKNLIEIIS